MFKESDTLSPTRLLMDSNTLEWNLNLPPSINEFNSYINEINPFDSHPSIFDQKSQHVNILPPSPPNIYQEKQFIQVNQSPSSVPAPKKQRKRLLEKNREAAYRCRQKKKKWVNELEERSETIEHKNKELQEQVSRLREESIYLRNLLLTHGNCDCDVVQTYLRRTSEQLSKNNNTCQMPALVGSASSISGSESSFNSTKQFYNSTLPIQQNPMP